MASGALSSVQKTKRSGKLVLCFAENMFWDSPRRFGDVQATCTYIISNRRNLNLSIPTHSAIHSSLPIIIYANNLLLESDLIYVRFIAQLMAAKGPPSTAIPFSAVLPITQCIELLENQQVESCRSDLLLLFSNVFPERESGGERRRLQSCIICIEKLLTGSRLNCCQLNPSIGPNKSSDFKQTKQLIVSNGAGCWGTWNRRRMMGDWVSFDFWSPV